MGYFDNCENNTIKKITLNTVFRGGVISPDDTSASLRVNGEVAEYLIKNGKVVVGNDGNPVIKNRISPSEVSSLIVSRKLDSFE